MVVCFFPESCRREVCVCGAEGGRGAQAAAAPPRERERPAEDALCVVQQRGDHYGIFNIHTHTVDSHTQIELYRVSFTVCLCCVRVWRCCCEVNLWNWSRWLKPGEAASVSSTSVRTDTTSA